MKKLFFSIVLLFVAILLYRIFGIIGFFVDLVVQLWRGPKYLAEYLYKLAIGIDQLGNVTSPTLLSFFLIDRGNDDYAKFGDEDETVSSVLGKNKEKGSLSKMGRALDGFLNFLDPGHSIKSIERDEG